jgi:hypothetical protein
MSFALSETVDPNKIFLTPKSDVAGRLDPFYYIPSLVALEEKVRKVTPYKLRDFVIRMAGGATPLTSESESHYTESEDGIPFIRVQNLSTTGRLNLEDCKRITRSTHETLLGRSKLSGGELLVKITGVGRMAVASVVPDHFEGNINQHIVAIQTKDLHTSETLAAYLNLDFAERLASRRSTGGTRPALDYPALLSLPVIFDESLPKLVNAAVEQFNEQMSNAAEVLLRAERLLLEQLEIELPSEQPDILSNRIFKRRFTNLSGTRHDPHFHRPQFQQLIRAIRQNPHAKLGHVISLSRDLWDQKSLFSDTFTYVEIGSVNMSLGRLDDLPEIAVAEAPSRARMLVRPGDLLLSLTRPTRRAIAFVSNNQAVSVASTGFAVIRDINTSKLLPRFLFHVLRSKFCAAQFDQRSSGGNYPAITEDQLLEVVIPLPDINKQIKVAKLLDEQYERAELLLHEASEELVQTKRKIEAMILYQGEKA